MANAITCHIVGGKYKGGIEKGVVVSANESWEMVIEKWAL